MRRKDFALSWGRKLFFGLGWLLTGLVALNYFRSMIIPQTIGGWFYYALTFVGHYGMILSLVYFLLFAPVVALFPTYYVSRIWSAFLLLSVNVLIFLDGHLFAKYRFHLNSFLFNLLREGEGKDVLGLNQTGMILLGVVTFVVFLVIWLRGERIWRSMQGRFSNPIKNWYLVLIFICFLGSHLFHMYGDAKGAKNITKISLLFPLNYPLTSKGFLKDRGVIDAPVVSQDQGYKDFYYPVKELSCSSSGAKNLIIVNLESWSSDKFNGKEMPQGWHVANHGMTFMNHFSGGSTAIQGLFSLYYSLPPAYYNSAISEKKESAFVTEVKKAKLDVINVDSTGMLDQFIPGRKESQEGFLDFLRSKRTDEIVPRFVANIYLATDPNEADRDKFILSLANALHAGKLVDSTIIVLTGTHATEEMSVNGLKTPLVVIWPDRDGGAVEKYTSHYDILPTIVREDWKCKNKMTDYSFGDSLFSKDLRNIHVAGDYQSLGIIDFELKSFTKITEYKGLEVRDFSSRARPKDLLNDTNVLNALEGLTFFFRRH